MHTKDSRIHRRQVKKLRRMLKNRGQIGKRPILSRSAVSYALAERVQVLRHGGIGAIQRLAVNSGLAMGIDESLKLLKFHKPYYESDHVLSICYNILCGGSSIEDLDLLRNDPSLLHALGADRIPDPTTAGDFLRRFDSRSIEQLQDAINEVRPVLWREAKALSSQDAIIQVDATIQGTTATTKQGMDMGYTGVMGFGPLIVSLANTREALYIENRPASTHSSVNAPYWIDKSIAVVKPHFKRVWLRGDTAYGLSEHFDRWHEEGINFVLGYQAHPDLIARAEALNNWRVLQRPTRKVRTSPRTRPDNVRQKIVVEKGCKDFRLLGEEIIEFDYSPVRNGCKHTYRLVIVKKDISVEKRQVNLFNEVRYFLYVTNDRDMSAEEVVYFANKRCDHENDIEQLRNGVKAFSLPSNTLDGNWAYMVIAALAWTLKAWFGLLAATQSKEQSKRIVRMEFKRFLNEFVAIPAQVIRHARKTRYQFVAYMAHAPTFFAVHRRVECAL